MANTEAPSVTLANAYRPKKFKEVFGQDAAVAALEGCFVRKNFPSVILLSGHFGCGKTSLATIFARQVNCEKHKLCGKCFSCKFGSKHPDVVHYDAAINGKIDEVRSLVAGARNAPTTRYRVIIADEVHMWRDASEKAMLLALENPSPKTIWILCTTNPEKLAKTLVSRCLHINLKPIQQEVLETRLLEIAEKEGVKSNKLLKSAVTQIAAMSSGSMREAVSKLEYLILTLASGKKFNAEMLMDIAGGADADLDAAAAELVAAVVEMKVQDAVKVIRVVNNARGILNKTRWLVDFLIGHKTNTAKFTPYSGRLFAQKKLKYGVTIMVMLQHVIAEAEIRMNSVSIDENVLLYTAIGNFIAENKE